MPTNQEVQNKKNEKKKTGIPDRRRWRPWQVDLAQTNRRKRGGKSSLLSSFCTRDIRNKRRGNFLRIRMYIIGKSVRGRLKKVHMSNFTKFWKIQYVYLKGYKINAIVFKNVSNFVNVKKYVKCKDLFLIFLTNSWPRRVKCRQNVKGPKGPKIHKWRNN